MERIIYFVIIVSALFIAAVSDVKKAMVNNIIPSVIAAAGIALTVAEYIKVQRISIILIAAGGAMTGFLFTAVPALKGGLGGADVKLTAALGPGLGISGTLYFMMLTFFCALIFQLSRSIVKKIRSSEKIDQRKLSTT